MNPTLSEAGMAPLARMRIRIRHFVYTAGVLLTTLVFGCSHRPAPPVEQPSTPWQQRAYAVPPGITEDATATIQAMLDKAAADGGGTVTLAADKYRLYGSLRVPPAVTLQGTWTAPHHARLNNGTVLMALGGRGSEEGPALVELEPSATLRGVTIYYPEQDLADLQPYPWTIRGRGMHNTVEDVTLVNPWQGIDIGTHANELHLIRNVFGCPLKTGIYINACTDIGRIENVHFNPHYWSRSEGDGFPRPDMEALMNHLVANADGFVFGRTDWQYVLNTFCYGYRAGYRFVATPEGLCNGNFVGIGADGCENAILVEAAAPYGILVTNGQFVGLRAPEPIQVVTRPTNNIGVLQFNNCSFWGPVAQIARLEAGTTSFHQCNFHHWDAKKEGRPAMEALGGDLVISNSNFQHGGEEVRLGARVRSAIVTGNLTRGPMDVNSQANPEKVRVEGNVGR